MRNDVSLIVGVARGRAEFLLLWILSVSSLWRGAARRQDDEGYKTDAATH